MRNKEEKEKIENSKENLKVEETGSGNLYYFIK